MNKGKILKKAAIFIVFVVMLIAARLTADLDSDAYKAAKNALYQSQQARDFFNGRIRGTVLVGLSNKYHIFTSHDSRVSIKCASRLFFVWADRFGFAEVTLRSNDEPDSKWQIREVLLGLSTPRSIPCPGNA